MSNWYKANKARLSEEKRRRYRTDPKYRAAAISRARTQTVLLRVQRLADPPTVRHAGKPERRYSLSELCATINRSRDSIFAWRRSGFMPMPIYRDNSRRGYYSESQVKYLKAVCEAHVSYNKMGEFLKKVWRLTFDPSKVKALSTKGD